MFFCGVPTVLMWNCQGVWRPSFLKNFNDLVHEHKPDIVVLLETWCTRKLLKQILLPYSIHTVTSMEIDDWYGGVVVLSMTSKVYFQVDVNGPESMDGYIKGINIID